MSQTKWQSFKEANTQTLVGFGVGLASQLVIFPLVGLDVPFTDNLIIGAWFTLISVTRGYVVRRIFNKKHDYKQGIRAQLNEISCLNEELLRGNSRRYGLMREVQEKLNKLKEE